MELYAQYRTEFSEYVQGLKRHGVRLSDLRLKMICKKWGIWVSDDLTQLAGEWDAKIHESKNNLFSLRFCYSFEFKLLNKVKLLHTTGETSRALLELYEGLQNELISGYHNQDANSIKNVNEFLKLYSKEEIYEMDMLVHILNVVSPRKEVLSFWPKFLAMAEKFIIETVGPEKGAQIMNVVR